MSNLKKYNGPGGDVTLEDGVTSIGEHAFSDCRNLTSIALPESLESIGRHAFSFCKNLISVDLPRGLKSIDECAFSCCSGMTSVSLPKELKSVGISVFWRCYSLTNVILPEGLKVIGEDMFRECSGLSSIEIPGSVTSFGSGAFHKCESLTSVTMHAGLKTVGKNAFMGCKSLTEVVLPEGLETIENGAFQGCRGLTVIEIPESVKRIGKEAFSSCKNLMHVTLPKGLETIGTDVFKGCDKLGDVEIPAGVTVCNKRPPQPRFSLGALYKQIGECLPPQPAVKLAVKKGKVGLYDSKLGGTPYFPRDMEFPRGRAEGFEGQPLTLLAQLNFDTLPHIPDFPTKGILQFFIAKDGRFGVGGYHGEKLTRQDNFRVIYHENVITDETKLLSADEIPQYVGDEKKHLLPFAGEYRIVAKKPADMAVTSSDHRFKTEALRICKEVYGKELENIYELDDAFDDILCEKLFEKAKGYEGTFLGGYPYLVQADPRAFSCTDCDTLLLEINYGDNCEADILWGDCGTGTFFIPRENLRALDFSRVLYNVDMG